MGAIAGTYNQQTTPEMTPDNQEPTKTTNSDNSQHSTTDTLQPTTNNYHRQTHNYIIFLQQFNTMTSWKDDFHIPVCFGRQCKSINSMWNMLNWRGFCPALYICTQIEYEYSILIPKIKIYRNYPRPPSLECCARNIVTVHRETFTQYIHLKEGGEGSLYSFTL